MKTLDRFFSRTRTGRESLAPYVRSLLFLAFSITVSLTFQPFLKTHAIYRPVIIALYLITAFAAAWWAGYAAGVAVVFICLEASIYTTKGYFSLRELPVILALAIIAVVLLIGWVAASRRRVEQMLRSSNDQLEAKVRERTAELERARDWLQTTLVSIGDAVIATDQRGNIVLMNPVAEYLTACRLADVAGSPLTEVFRIVNEETWEPAENPVSKVLSRGAIVALANHTVLLARDGREIAIDDGAAPIRDGNGNISGVVLTFRDIADRRSLEAQRERMLRETSHAREQIYSIFRQAPAIINLKVGPDHVFEVVHPMTEQLAGRDITGMPFREAFPDLVEQGILDVLNEVYRSGSTRSLPEHPLRFTLPDGTSNEVFVSLTFQPWRDPDGTVAGVITAGINVTEQVRVRREMAMSEERLREAARLESLGVMAGGIAHDFNNLLVGIMGNASLALEIVAASSPAAAMLQDLLNASEQAALLIRQMLAYSGKGKFIVEPVDIGLLVGEILPSISRSIPSNVILKTRLSERLPAVEGDRSQLQQVIMNLVINAAEACGSAPGNVRVTTSTCDHSVLLSVSDTGSGMTAEIRARIFDPFFTTKFTGRGLGLSAVQGIIRAHNGTMEIDTAPGQGTTFRVLFPASTDAIQAPVRTDGPGDLSGHATILVVDDEELVRNVIQLGLERQGYNVLIAADGSEALKVFEQRSKEIGLVLLDLTMPGLTGDIVFRTMRHIDPAARVILTSGYNESDAMARFESSGVSGFLQKPFTSSALAEKTKAALESNPLSRSAAPGY